MRLEELRIILANKGIDSLFLYGRDGVKEYNIEYFADVYPLSACKLLITKSASTLFVPEMELQRMKKVSKIPVRVFNKRKLSGRVGFNGNYLSINELKRIKKDNPKANFVDTSEEIVKLRSLKSSEEIRRIKEACRITDKILVELTQKIRSFNTEKNVESFILERTKELGLEPAFPPIVAAGSNAANPHHAPTNARLEGWCILDMGVKYKGYCSDITRTWFFGKPPKKTLKVYNEVLEAQKLGIRMASVNSTAKNIDISIRKGLGKESRHFIHSTGHSVGREVHDPGISISSKSKSVLKDCMVVTIEPGLYWNGIGGLRIEDTVLVTKSGGKPLTNFSKELLVFE